ncbi:BTB/POZ and MATH domain-containing protein 2-like [Setaria italica]|uniref:BTB/POZ and MATH domain-containing protein 2-like n=1 Tax=Setaria italica TaxID=4555 RepID=UPI000646A2A2|nr:BTB/POZ and MATH domain-containing protein 2-like [Setaria italica]
MADVLQSFLPKDLGRLLATKEGADVDFEVGGMVFAAHRCVLAARSPVSKADLFGPTMEENTSYIRINDMNAETFQALLHYIYTDSLPDMNDQEVGAMAHHLLSAADRIHFPGLVERGGRVEPAYTWDHYVAADDFADRENRSFPNKALQVKGELWDFYRCQEGFEARVNAICDEVAKKLVKDMHYESRIQAII